MKKLLLLIITGLLFSWAAMAQSIGINTTTPNANAVLDIKSNTKGILIPRTSTTSRLAIVNPPKGLILYDSTAGSFWFYNGTAWAALSTGNNAWSTTGNSGTDTAINFIGTKDVQPLRFRINNNWAGQLDSINMVLGIGSGQNMSSGIYNAAFGTFTLNSNSSGSNNIAIGFAALAGNTTATGNIAIGTGALANQSFSNNAIPFNSDNVAIGANALYNNNPNYYQSGIQNTAIGNYSMASNTVGFGNTAVGYYALNNNNYGSDNTSFGSLALYKNQDGSSNTVIGMYALKSNISGSGNTVIGSSADNDGSGLNFNTIVGYHAHITNASGSTAIGYNANTNTDNLIVLGSPANLYTGGYTFWSNFSDGRFKTNVNEDVKGIDFIMRLRPVTYHMDVRGLYKFWGTSPYNRGTEKPDARSVSFIDDAITKKEAITMSGFIAQEVEKAATETQYNFDGVIKPQHDKDHYRIAYEEFVVPLVKAMQEQQAMIETLNKQLAAMKKEFDLLKTKNLLL
jgi:hypothetical protein